MVFPKDKGMTLVFPAINQAAIEYLRTAEQRGEETVCAASVASSEIHPECGEVHHLPMIYDQDFAEHFLLLVKSFAIRRLFSPIVSVYGFMQHFINDHHLDIELIGESPIRQQVQLHHQLMRRARRLLPLVELCADSAPALTLREVAGVLRQASLIYGESNDDKLAALMGIFASAPAGDVVEVGSLMGRSAFVLLYLARRYGIGPVLTVDPWLSQEAIQRESPESFQTLVNDWDFEVLSEGFFINLVPFSAGRHAHMRLTSTEAFKAYANGDAAQTRVFDDIAYSGRIAVIHIDGNHDYEHVKDDCERWLSRMVPDAWLILDDYTWAHGDGPYRVGNELLYADRQRIKCAFVCGKALFLKFDY